MTTLRVTLRDEDQLFVAEALRSGKYATESEVVSEAIAELRAREELREVRLREVRSKIQVGLAELDAGLGRPWSIESVEEKGKAILAAQQKNQ